MRVVFGWHLDGPTFPETADGALYSLNSAVVGPMGMVDLIETSLGLDGPKVTPALRIAQYHARLRTVEDGARFYSGSLTADGWATSRLLLGWRDSLIAGGWNPGASSWTSDRLTTLADVEELGEPRMASRPSDRLRIILHRLEAPSPIDSLTVIDPFDLLPPAWTQLFDALESAGTTVEIVECPPQAADSDLALLQERLLSGSRAQLTGDDSFVIVRSDDEWLAAEIAAGWLGANPDANDDLVIIRQGDSTVLDEACHRLGLPRPGGSERSRWRGAIQVLSLAFETAWAPLNAGRLLELLVMAGSPIRPSIGHLFAKALRDAPGIGGPTWLDAWETAKDRYGAALDDGERDAAAIEKALAEEEVHWRTWLEPKRFDREAGIPADKADEICRRVQTWALRRAAGTEDSIYQVAAQMATASAEVISTSGLERITKAQIDRMIDAVLADGVQMPGNVAEAAPWSPVDRPSQIWGPVGSVLWWGFMDPSTYVSALPWSVDECQEFEASGCQLESPGALLALETAAWRRAILNARERVVCVVPSTVAGEAMPPHPLWHEIREMVETGGRIIEGRALLGSPELVLGGRGRDQIAVDPMILPSPRRTWHVDGERIAVRERESATSIENLLGCPFRWALEYQAGIEEGPLLDVADNNRLKGTLAHAIIADLFTGSPLADESAVREQAEALVERYLPQIATPFLMLGRVRDREEVRRHTVDAAVEIFKFMRDAGLTVVSAEQKHERKLDEETNLIGIIDLHLRTAADVPIVVDLKWANSDRYRREEIVEGRPVQLATYSHLLEEDAGGVQPPAAYFMLKQQRLLATASAPFPVQSHIPGTNLGSVWRAVVAARTTELKRIGQGEITAAGVEAEEVPLDASDPDTMTLEPPCRFCRYGHLCGREELR